MFLISDSTDISVPKYQKSKYKEIIHTYVYTIYMFKLFYYGLIDYWPGWLINMIFRNFSYQNQYFIYDLIAS